MLTFRVMAAALIAASSLGAQAIVRGTVLAEHGTRVAGAELMVAALNKAVRSDSAGEYRLVLPAGQYRLTVRAMGYFSVSDSISPENGVELIKDIQLTSTATLLDTVNTTAPRRVYASPLLRDFEERRKTHMGRYISEVEFRQSDDRLLSDVLRKIPGMVVSPGRNNEYWAAATRTGGSAAGALRGARGKCYVTIYVDGVLMFDQGMTVVTPGRPGNGLYPPDLNLMSPREMAGAEYYASSAAAPAQYKDRSGCGLLLLWTRER